jgi:hypothetical protein
LTGLPCLEKIIVFGTAEDQSDNGVTVLVSQAVTLRVLLKLIEKLVNKFDIQGLQLSVAFRIQWP